MRILYVGEGWQGSTARALREALIDIPGLEVADLSEDAYLPRQQVLALRLANRVFRPLQRRALGAAIKSTARVWRPDVLMVYKGWGVDSTVIDQVRDTGVFTVNVYPDLSPHAFGARHREAVGRYDLIVSNKDFHPAGWQATYGYDNRCVFVPHGYDPRVHLWLDQSERQPFDVALAATRRPEYEALVANVGELLSGREIGMALAGQGWGEARDGVLRHWTIEGTLLGRAYGAWLRSAKIVIAPLQTHIEASGALHPGEQDSTRTYELAAAHCFFTHRRTPRVQQLYDEGTEVPMWDDPKELANIILRFLEDPAQRRSMAEAAHRRAVPAYSVTARAEEMLDTIRREMKEGRPSRDAV